MVGVARLQSLGQMGDGGFIPVQTFGKEHSELPRLSGEQGGLLRQVKARVAQSGSEMFEYVAGFAEPSPDEDVQQPLCVIQPLVPLHSVQGDQLSRRRGRRCPIISHKVADTEIHLVTHSGDHGDI